MKEGQKITIRVGEREYGLKVMTEEAEMTTRRAAELLNNDLTLYQSKYPTRDFVDVLSFVAINQCMSKLRLEAFLEAQNQDAQSFADQLEDYLKNIEK